MKFDEEVEAKQIAEALERQRIRAQWWTQPRWRLPAGLTEAELFDGYARPVATREAVA